MEINKLKLLEKIKFRIEGASAPHEREIKKPNEDRLFFDEENGIFILLDGVTRPHSEYEEHPYESAALELGNIFIDEAYRFIRNNIDAGDPEALLRDAVRAANSKIKEYRGRKSEEEWRYFPSTLGFVGLIRGSTLYYASAGDCIGVLIRRDAKMLIGREWTLEAVDKLNVSKKERYESYCNHPKKHLSYTVFNGDEVVEEGLQYSFIDLHEGDTLLIASDGIGDYIKYEKNADLIKQSPVEMIAGSGKYDLPPYAEYADDKTLIKIMF